MDDFNPMDMMCEVVMEEGDEAPLPIDNDNFSLPPIPTFDLQSDSFTYLPPVPVLTRAPTGTSTAKTPTRSTIASSTAMPSISPGNNVAKTTPSRKSATTGLKIRSVEDVNELDDSKEQIASFKLKLYSKKEFTAVFETPDQYPKNLTQITNDEIKYYGELFSDTSMVRFTRMHCTSCQKHVGMNADNMKSHRMLYVPSCKSCYEFYGDGVFPKDKSDDTEIYCRWCGQGGEQLCCSFCPKVFCYKCVRDNFGPEYLEKIQKVSDWACFCCAQMPLWPLRAIARAAIHYIRNSPNPLPDTCCTRKGRPRKILPKAPEPSPPAVRKPMVVFHQTLPPVPSGVRLTGPIYRPAGPRLSMATRPALRPRMPVRGAINVRPTPPMIRPASSLVRQASPRPALPPIRPASSLSRQQTVNQIPAKQMPLTMPDVHMDHSVQDHMVVRLRMPNNKEQFLRVNVTGKCMRVPKLATNGPVNIQALHHSFRTCQFAFNRLMNIKQIGEKGASVESQMADIADTLSKWKESIQLLEMDLKKNSETFKRQKAKNQVVIDIDVDAEGDVIKWDNAGKIRDMLEDDSDVEIIDDDEEKSTRRRKRKQSFCEMAPTKKRKTSVNGPMNGEPMEVTEKDPLAVEDDADVDISAQNATTHEEESLEEAKGGDSVVDMIEDVVEANGKPDEEPSTQVEVKSCEGNEPTDVEASKDDSSNSASDVADKSADQSEETEASGPLKDAAKDDEGEKTAEVGSEKNTSDTPEITSTTGNDDAQDIGKESQEMEIDSVDLNEEDKDAFDQVDNESVENGLSAESNAADKALLNESSNDGELPTDSKLVASTEEPSDENIEGDSQNTQECTKSQTEDDPKKDSSEDDEITKEPMSQDDDCTEKIASDETTKQPMSQDDDCTDKIASYENTEESEADEILPDNATEKEETEECAAMNAKHVLATERIDNLDDSVSLSAEQSLLDEIEKVAYDSHDVLSDDVLHEAEIAAN